MSIPKQATEAAARVLWANASSANPRPWDEAGDGLRDRYRLFATAALVAAAPIIANYARVEAIADAACYLERIHPAGLTPRNAVLADLAVVESRMMRGLRANGNARATTIEGETK